MKKLTTLAFVATLLMAGAAFAARPGVVANPNATFIFGSGGAAPGPSTTNNDDSCDIGVTPAATLLLPYFEVETATRATDTFFTVVNTGYLAQIAHVVVWTDWSYPVLDFNIFLTGFDVQSISMYDVIVNGIIAPIPNSTTFGGTSSTASATSGGVQLSPIGSFSAANAANPNIHIGSCGTLAGKIQTFVTPEVQSLLINGSFPGVCTLAGSPSSAKPTATTAVGYVTIDVASVCSQNMPDAPLYVRNEILFDNVLTGDYEILNKAAGSNYAGGNPLVHIRAIPEGGKSGADGGTVTPAQTNLPYTFYQRYETPTVFPAGFENFDRRQPLPSTFAARWIQGGTNAFNTSYRIWREGATGVGTTLCNGTGNSADLNSALPVTAIVRFDEHENPAIAQGLNISVPLPSSPTTTFPETSTDSTAGSQFPQFPSGSPAGDVGGWMYMDLNSHDVCPVICVANLALHPTWPNAGARASQNWVIVSMTAGTGGASANGLFGVDFDATWLGNGCTAPANVPTNNVNPGIGPAGGILFCPQGDPSCAINTPPYTGTNATP